MEAIMKCEYCGKELKRKGRHSGPYCLMGKEENESTRPMCHENIELLIAEAREEFFAECTRYHRHFATSLQPVVVCSDGVHCGDCPHLKPYGAESDLTAKCGLTGNDLMWHDYWIAECDTHNKQI
jgi:hypothetical protein